MKMIDIHSVTWKYLLEQVEKEQLEINKRILLKNLDIRESDFLRGSYVALEMIKKIPEPKEKIIVETTPYN